MLDSQIGQPDSVVPLTQLLDATARGDRAAFEKLYAATSAKLYGTAIRILKRRDLADDVVQEAYVRIWRHAGRFDPARGSPITWMATIVRHLAIDLARRNRDGQTGGGEDELLALASDGPDPFDALAMAERHQRVRAVLARLDPMKRRLIIAAYLHGESREELAKRFGAPVNTIKTWLRRAVLEMLAAAPLYTPRMPNSGKPMSVQMSNCGPLGWVTDAAGYRYQSIHPETGTPWPPMPAALLAAWQELSGYPHPPEACLINFYAASARMGLHQDRDEEDFAAPVVSLSLGDTCLFRIGGLKRGDPTRSLPLASGDAIVLGGPARLAFHGVDRIMAGTSTLLPQGGRINLTLRRVTRT